MGDSAYCSRLFYSLEEDIFFKSIDVPRDGACMFHSVSYLLHGNLGYTQALRHECCNYIRMNAEYFAEQVLLVSIPELEEYVNELARASTYAGYVELGIIFIKYNVSIWIYTEIGNSSVIKTIFKENAVSPRKILKLLYINGNHYMPLVETAFSEIPVQYMHFHADTNNVLNSLIVEEELDGSMDMDYQSTVDENMNERQVDVSIEENGMDVEDQRVIGNDTTNEEIADEDSASLNDGIGNNVPPICTSIEDIFIAPFAHAGRREYEEGKIPVNYLGRMKDQVCDSCGAYHFVCERTTRNTFTKCCMNGKYIFEFDFSVPQIIRDLLDATDTDSSHFKNHIRQYNAALAFASFGASITAKNVPGRGPYAFKIQGIPYHLSSNLQSQSGARKYAQLYFIDSSEANMERSNRNPNLQLSLLSKLDEFMRKENTYGKTFLNLRERQELEMSRNSGTSSQCINYSVWLLRRPNDDKNRYNLPTSNEVAAVFSSADGCPPYLRDIEIHNRNGDRIKLSILSPHTDPMTYPIFYPYGKGGWSLNLRGKFGKNKISMLNYYSYILSVREKFSAFLHGGKLTQQFIDDAYCKMEAQRLNYYRQYQSNLRVDFYQGLHDYMKRTSEAEDLPLGKAVILPSSFPGSPRHMAQNFQDAMSIVSKFGKPDLFITFTCNPKWPEITENLEPYESPSDRPDLVARVFYEKFSAFIEELTRVHVLGCMIAFTYVFEWQKRGMPHGHFVGTVALEDKVRTGDDIDKIISAEIPDKETQPEIFEIIKSNMIHGPCGDKNKYSPCMVDNVCSKKYPKTYSENTIFSDGGFPKYRRRENGRCIIIRRSNNTILKVDNRDIVPYNPYLSVRFNAHINVEVCTTIKSVKYLFKYIHKGHSCISLSVNSEQEPVHNYDEITGYLNARYVGPCEAFHRIYGYNLHENSHCIYRLPVHLENMQSVYFNPGEEESVLMNDAIKHTRLTEWFTLNKYDADARKYLYNEIPEYYVWKSKECKWTKRKKNDKPLLGRLYNVGAREGERFYLRLLLLHRAGCTSFADVRTINGTTYNTYREAAQALNLLCDDTTWHNTIAEAIQYQMPFQLRQLFAGICVFCEPSDPYNLWNTFINEMVEDFTHQGNARDVAIEKGLLDLNSWFEVHGKNNADFNIPLPNMTVITETTPYAIISNNGEDYYNPVIERQNGVEKLGQCNADQSYIVKCIMHVLYPTDQEWVVDNDNNDNRTAIPPNCNLFLINAAAGTGKTWVYNVLLHLIRGNEDDVVPLAFTGIAASLLVGGKTLHSALRLPLSLDETSTCGLTCRQKYAKFIKNAKLIVIDEISMCPKLVLNAINKFLRELMSLPHVPFGGKTILFGGDFMQTLPVIKHGNRVQIISNTVKCSDDWDLVHTFDLHKNMRVKPHAMDYAEWILKIGKNMLSTEDGLAKDMVKIPPECVVSSDNLIESIFGAHLRVEDVLQYKDKAILTPLNEDTFKLNNKVLEILEGDTKTYLSQNSIAIDEDSDNFAEVSSEYLMSITPSGMAPHTLNLKCGAIVILLRNLNTKKGLCNGTRLLITHMLPNVLKAEIVTGTMKGTTVLIPRIILYSGKEELPFNLKRVQFPIRLAFSITINKGQGQSYETTGIFLPKPVFAHGQLYVAFSRARSFDDIRVVVDDFNKPSPVDNTENIYTQNIVYEEMI